MQAASRCAIPYRRIRTDAAIVAWIGPGLVAATVLVCAAMLGPDATWDLRNYHLYNGYAWLHGRVGVDLAPAQMQTFFSPVLDIAYALLLSAFNHMPRLLAALLAVPHALAAALLMLLARRLLPPGQALAAVAIGMTGAAALPTLGTTMSEMAPAACVLGALLLVLGESGSVLSWRGAGLLAGFAVGLKLTAAPYGFGLLAMLPLTRPGRRMERLFWFAAGSVVGAGLTSGFWWWSLWQRFADPVFPFFNQVFHSPWAAPVDVSDHRFFPGSIVQALVYPLFWAFRPTTLVSELPVRDPRIALGWVAAILITARALGRRRCGRGAALAAFWVISYGVWEASFSTFRYLSVLELLSGVLILAAVQPLLDRCAGRWRAAYASGLAVLLVAVTIYPRWGRASPGPAAVAVEFPPIPRGSLVVLLDPSPMAYVAGFTSQDISFVGADNNQLYPGEDNRLTRAVEAKIRGWTGPLWGLEMPRNSPGYAGATLRFYGLRRTGECMPVRSNLDSDGILACPLGTTKGFARGQPQFHETPEGW